ncbi:MAG TPA: histidine kinase dimerization/phospho-acceptor domain-containing protein, partial [Acidobacteriaceae bacterium]|nr:histidine kinase dimerization/phospho-acceptor domain-containing protein [Acidobacteriaceae bacterium]
MRSVTTAKLVCAAILLLFVINGVLLYRATGRLGDDLDRVGHTLEVQLLIDTISNDVYAFDNEVRSRWNADRAPAPRGALESQIESEMRQLERLTADNPSQQGRLQEFRALILAHEAQFAETEIGGHTLQGLESTLDAHTQSLLSVLRNMNVEESGLLQQRQQRADGARREVMLELVTGTVGGMSLAALLFMTYARSQRREHESLMRERAAEMALRERELQASELEIRHNEAERANRLKSEFLASMSHELRTPLHTILGFTELLRGREDGELTETQDRFLAHIEQDGDHLLNLINGLLDLSKIEAGHMELRCEPLSLSQCIREAVEGMQVKAGLQAISLEVTSGQEMTVQADPMRLKEVLYNLLSNALKFTPEGGRVSVDTSTEAGYACVTVSDNGIGIAAEDYENIFEKFFQA